MDARKALRKVDQDRILHAVAEAEKNTSAEIVCAVATESGRYDRAESIVGLVVALLALGGAHAATHGFVLGEGEWSTLHGIGLGWQSLAVVLGFVAGSLLASYAHPLRALFVSSAEMEAEVWRGAARVMHVSEAHNIASRCAIVIYASLFERRVVVLAGKTAAEALGEDGLNKIRDAALGNLKAGKVGDAFIAAVGEAARLAAYALPPRESNPDEMANRVLAFHPRP